MDGESTLHQELIQVKTSDIEKNSFYNHSTITQAQLFGDCETMSDVIIAYNNGLHSMRPMNANDHFA